MAAFLGEPHEAAADEVFKDRWLALALDLPSREARREHAQRHQRSQEADLAAGDLGQRPVGRRGSDVEPEVVDLAVLSLEHYLVEERRPTDEMLASEVRVLEERYGPDQRAKGQADEPGRKAGVPLFERFSDPVAKPPKSPPERWTFAAASCRI